MRLKPRLHGSVLCAGLFGAWTIWSLWEHLQRIPGLDHLGLEPKNTYAFATFLGKNVTSNGLDGEIDKYYESVRQLAYALLHSPTTKAEGIPFLVLCTNEVPPHKRAQLEEDGATIVSVNMIESDWLQPRHLAWRDMLTKLRLFQLTGYEKICYMDADIFVYKSPAGVFDDPATFPRAPGRDHDDLNGAVLPREYVLAAHSDAGYDGVSYAPEKTTFNPYFNAGFFVIKPSQTLFEYYMELLQHPGLFDPEFVEQNLLNYAHHRNGSMPWQPLPKEWNVNWPEDEHLEHGVRTFHDKFWEASKEKNAALTQLWRKQKAEMEDFHQSQSK